MSNFDVLFDINLTQNTAGFWTNLLLELSNDLVQLLVIRCSGHADIEGARFHISRHLWFLAIVRLCWISFGRGSGDLHVLFGINLTEITAAHLLLEFAKDLVQLLVIRCRRNADIKGARFLISRKLRFLAIIWLCGISFGLRSCDLDVLVGINLTEITACLRTHLLL